MPFSAFESETLTKQREMQPKTEAIHQRDVPDLMQLTELVEEVRWQANEHGTQKENQQAVTLENRSYRHGFLSCYVFF